jgi:nucleoside-diphosphate-sugar epimerase
MTRVLVTGASGFIGAPALAALAQRGAYEIHATARHLPEGPPAGIHWHTVDLFDRERIRPLLSRIGATHLLHLAWSVEPGVFRDSPQNRAWKDASLSLFRDFADAGGMRIVAAGTCSEYAGGDTSLSEGATAERPESPYGEAKLATWRGLESLAGETGLSAAWGRVFFLYGPREHPKRLVASVIRALLLGERAATTAGLQRRDFLHVEDVASALAALADSDVRGPVNIASGFAVEVRDLVRKIAGKIGREDLLDIGTLPSPESEPSILEGRVDRLMSDVGWRPRFGLDSGLDHTISWWKATLGQE